MFNAPRVILTALSVCLASFVSSFVPESVCLACFLSSYLSRRSMRTARTFV